MTLRKMDEASVILALLIAGAVLLPLVIIAIVICVLAIISGVVLYVKRLRRRRNLPKDNKFRVVERL